MKKRLFLILLTVLAVVLVFSACGGGGDDTDTATNPDAPATDTSTQTGDPSTPGSSDTDTNGGTPAVCTHDWVFTSGTASCTTGGDATFTCSLCQETKTETTEALGHNMQKASTVAATCVTKGYDLYTCANGCGQSEQRNETPAGITKYHNFETKREEPTCVETGSTVSICVYCGTSAGDAKTLPVLGHTFERKYGEDETDPTIETVVAPKCEVDGQITRKCADCDEMLILTYESLTVEGATDAELALAETIKALEHDYSVESEKIDATCLTAGHLIMECANGCGKTTKVADYPALGHTYTREGVTEFKYETRLEPTCITAGTEWFVCDDCKYCAADDEVANVDFSRDIPATGEHVYDEFVSRIAPDCSEGGYELYKCTADEKCGAQTRKNEVDALGHNWVLDTDQLKKVDGEWVATCLTNGNIPYYCDNYGAGYGCLEEATCFNAKGETPSAIRHTGYTQGVYASEPTCIKNAFYNCDDCGQTFEAYEDDTAARASGVHACNKEAEVVPATCTTYGYTKYVCSLDDDCTEFKYDDYTVRAAHTLSEVSADGITVCEECAQSFVNTTTQIATEFKDGKKVVVSSEGTRLCDPRCTGCAIHDILVFVTASTAPEAATELVQDGDAYKTTYAVDAEKKVSLIELTGGFETEYSITLKDKDGNEIKSFTANINDKDVDLDIAFVTEIDAAGTMYVDIAEVAENVATIEISSTTAASVNYYTNYND